MKGTLWITGVAGFSGRHLAHYIASRVGRPRVVGIDVCDAPSLPLDAYHRLDLCDAAAVAAAARGPRPTWVIHLAGVPPAAPAGDLWRGHVGATLGLATGLVRAGCRQTRVLSIGSAAEYQPANRVISERFGPGPSTEYGRSKLGQTLLTIGLPRTLGLRACVARTFNLVGPGLPTRFVLGRLCAEFTRVGPRGSITLQHLETSRDFIDVRDAVDAYWRLVRRGRSGDIYNVCSGVAVSLTELIEHLSAATGKRPVIRTTHTHDRARDPDIMYGSFAKLARATGWRPQIDLSSSIRAMLADAGAASSSTRRRASGATAR